MPVIDTHPDYDKNLPLVSKCRDCYDGEEAIKGKGETYLPRLSEQTDPEYAAYLGRAMFYTGTYRTVKGLAGAVMHKTPQIIYPQDKIDSLARVGVNGESLELLCKIGVEETLTASRIGLLVDRVGEEDDKGTNAPFIARYSAESVVNWKYRFVNGRLEPSLVVLKEDVDEEVSGDQFARARVTQYRVLYLKQEGEAEPVYTVDIWRKVKNETTGKEEWVIYKTITPKAAGGKTLDYIPFAMVNPSTVGPEVEKPPVLDLANVNLSHFRTSADLEHGRHFTALPTPFLSGVPTTAGPIKIGSTKAILASDPNSRGTYIEFTGVGLKSLSDALQEKQELMALLGAKLLEQTKKAQEAAATVQLRQSGENSILANTAISVGEGFTKCLQWLLKMQGVNVPDENPEKVASIVLNLEYSLPMVDSPTLSVLAASLTQGQISWDTWFYNLNRFGFIPEGVTSEDEKAKIELNPMSKPDPNADIEADNQEQEGSGANGNQDKGTGDSPGGEGSDAPA